MSCFTFVSMIDVSLAQLFPMFALTLLASGSTVLVMLFQEFVGMLALWATLSVSLPQIGDWSDPIYWSISDEDIQMLICLHEMEEHTEMKPQDHHLTQLADGKLLARDIMKPVPQLIKNNRTIGQSVRIERARFDRMMEKLEMDVEEIPAPVIVALANQEEPTWINYVGAAAVVLGSTLIILSCLGAIVLIIAPYFL